MRRADDDHRLFPAVVAADQSRLLADMLGVMTGVGLVRHQRTEGGGKDRKVGVDLDPRPGPAEVVVEAAPRLAGDKFELDALPLGQAEHEPGPFPEVLGNRGDRRVEAVGGTACDSRQAT